MSPIGVKRYPVSAFTLLEAVLYLALVSVLFLGLVYFLIGVTNSRSKSIAIAEVEDNGRIALHQLARLVRGASSIDWSLSSLDNHPGRLVINSNDGRVYSLSVDPNGYLIITQDGLASELTSNLVRVTQLIFRRYDDTTVGVALGLRYWPQGTNQSFDYQNDWQNSLRIVK